MGKFANNRRGSASNKQRGTDKKNNNKKPVANTPIDHNAEPVMREIQAKQPQMEMNEDGEMEEFNFDMPKWFDDTPKDLNVKPTGERPTPEQIASLYVKAMELHRAEAEAFEKSGGASGSSDAKWMKQLLNKGTTSDRVAAASVSIQSNPLYALQPLQSLIAMSGKRGRDQAIASLEALKDLFVLTLLPSDRKLVFFKDQPLLSVLYNSVAHTLNAEKEVVTSGHQNKRVHPKRDRRPKNATGDNVIDIQQANKLLVHMYFEDKLKHLFAEFVSGLERWSHDQLLHTKNVVTKITFDLLVDKPEQEVLLLTTLVNKLGDPERKIASRAAYFLSSLLEKHPSMKQVVVVEVERFIFRPSINDKAQYYGIIFLNQIMFDKQNQDRSVATKLVTIYFDIFKKLVEKGEIDRRMMNALLTGVNRAFPFADIDDKTIEEHTATLFKITHVSPFSTSVQALMLLFQVMMSRSQVSDRFYNALYEKLLSEDLLKPSHRLSLFLNLLYKSLKHDVTTSRQMAFVKRMIQVASHSTPSFTCGVLYMLSELFKHHPKLFELITINPQREKSEDEEHFTDAVPEEPEQTGESDEESDSEENQDEDKKVEAKKDRNSTDYDPRKRNASYANAHNSCLWELCALLHHFQPSVEKWALHLKDCRPIQHESDPLEDFSLMSFLDKFIYKKPKAKYLLRMYDKTKFASRFTKRKRLSTTVVNTDEFRAKSAGSVRDDEKFFHKYFTAKHEINEFLKLQAQLRKEAKLKKKNGGNNDFAQMLERYEADSDDDDLKSLTESVYSYGDLDEQAFYDNTDAQFEDNMDDQDLEGYLLDNISDSENEGEEEDEQPARKKAKKSGDDFEPSFDVTAGDIESSAFADADEFADMLEGAEETRQHGKKWSKQKTMSKVAQKYQDTDDVEMNHGDDDDDEGSDEDALFSAMNADSDDETPVAPTAKSKSAKKPKQNKGNGSKGQGKKQNNEQQKKEKPIVYRFGGKKQQTENTTSTEGSQQKTTTTAAKKTTGKKK